MCGRYTLHARDRIKLKGLIALDLPFEARYNIAPSQRVLAIADFGKGLEGRLLTWGLIPSWRIDGKGFINARAETLEEKPSFSESFRWRRCLIPADGFFEWKRTGREKRPYYFQLRDEGQVMFAGIWDTWRARTETIVTCAIITTPANELVGELHDRMPAILPLDVQEAWLERRTRRDDLLRMLTPYPAPKMKMHPISQTVNSPEIDHPELLLQVDNEVGTTPSLF